MSQGQWLLSHFDQKTASGQVVPNFILQVGQSPLWGQKVTAGSYDRGGFLEEAVTQVAIGAWESCWF